MKLLIANLRRQLKALRSGTSVSSTAAADNNDSDSSTVDGDGTSGVAESDTPTLLDLEDRRSGTFKKLAGEAKIRKIEELYDSVPRTDSNEKPLPLTKAVTGSARTWYNKTAKPLVLCLRNHFNSDYAEFVGKWNTDKRVDGFQKNCCKGTGDQCNK